MFTMCHASAHKIRKLSKRTQTFSFAVLENILNEDKVPIRLQSKTALVSL